MSFFFPLKGLLCIFLASAAALCSAAQFKAVVEKVSDGDTITVVRSDGSKERIRFLGIDAPESKQEFGPKSRNGLEKMLAKTDFKVTIVYHDTKGRDHYGRILGKVVADGKDINLEQLKKGNAWFYRDYERSLSSEDRTLYAEAEAAAKTKRTGLWAADNPEAPWEWRKDKREGAQKTTETKSSGGNPDFEFSWEYLIYLVIAAALAWVKKTYGINIKIRRPRRK